MRLSSKTDVIKASPAIHIQSNITHLQRRAWNVLLANAYDELPTSEIHSVKIVELSDNLEFDSKNDDYLKDALTALQGCQVTWNLLNKDGKQEWGVASLLAEAKVSEGLCTYAYSPTMRKQLHNPRIYAKINLRLQNKFKSKSSLILWELCVDYFDDSRNGGETPFIPLETFRELMGLSNKEYPQFKLLNHHVIKASIKEINDISDFHVEVEYQKKGRKVVAVKFIIRKLKKVNEQTKAPRQGGLFSDLDDLPPVVIDMIHAGMHRPEAMRIWNKGFNFVQSAEPPDTDDWNTYLRGKVQLLKLQPEVKNRGGWLRDAIANNWTSDHVKKQEQTKKREAAKFTRLKLEREFDQLKLKKTQAENAVCQQIIEDNPRIVDDLLKALLEEKPFYSQHYDTTKTALENYQRAMFSVHVDGQLRERHPDKFDHIDQEYDPRIDEIKAELDKLQPKRNQQDRK